MRLQCYIIVDWILACITGAGQGVWNVSFDPVADVQHVYTVKAVLNSQTPIILSNVLFGDVWICSGQSNMKLPVEQVLYIRYVSKTVGRKLITFHYLHI